MVQIPAFEIIAKAHGHTCPGIALGYKIAVVAATDAIQKEYLLQLGNEVFIAIVLMSLITTVIVPLVYRGWFFRSEMKPDAAAGVQQ